MVKTCNSIPLLSHFQLFFILIFSALLFIISNCWLSPTRIWVTLVALLSQEKKKKKPTTLVVYKDVYFNSLQMNLFMFLEKRENVIKGERAWREIDRNPTLTVP